MNIANEIGGRQHFIETWIMRGNVFRLSTGLITLSSSDKEYIYFTPPEEGHFLLILSGVMKSGDEILISWYEGATYTPNAPDDVYFFNLNRKEDLITGLEIKKDKNGTLTGGTELPGIYLGGSANPQTLITGASKSDHFFVLKNNTLYVTKIENVGTNDTNVLLNLSLVFIQ